MELSVGQKLISAVCGAQVVVVKAPPEAVELECGGRPMVPDGEESPVSGAPDASIGDAALLGKRYADDDLGLEVLCTRAGEGALTLGGRILPIKGAKPLPSSD